MLRVLQSPWQAAAMALLPAVGPVGCMVVKRVRIREILSTIPNILNFPDGMPTAVDVDGIPSSLTAISSSSSSLESQMAWSFVGDGATSFPLNVLPAWEVEGLGSKCREI